MNIEKILKDILNSNFGINKEKLVNKLYNKIVNFVTSNSWRRQWSDKEEKSWYDKGEKTFGFLQIVLLPLFLNTHLKRTH